MVPIFSTTILATPTLNSASIDESSQLLASISRGSDDPDFTHYHIYYSSSAGIDIGDSGTYDGILQSTDGNVLDLGPWTAPIYLVVTEVAYDGEESSGTSEYEIAADGGGGPVGGSSIAAYILLLDD